MQEHQSFFSYPITRPWPFRWFTPLVIIGGVTAAVILSIINYVSNGYELQTIYTSSPQDALPKLSWAQQQLLSWKNDIRGTCEFQNIATGSQIFTNHSGFTHTLSKVKDESNSSVSALRYYDNVLEDCQVKQIVVELKRADTARASGGWWSWRNTDATATSSCTVRSSNSSFLFNVTTSFKLQPGNLDFLLDSTPGKDHAKWWGGQLLHAYYMIMTQRMSQLSPATGINYDFGRFILSPDVKGKFDDKSMFDFTFYWQQSDGTYKNTDRMIREANNRNLRYLYNNPDLCLPDDEEGEEDCEPYPDLADEVEGFAAALYSLIMIDFGSNRTNILTDPDLLQPYLQGTGSDRLSRSSVLRGSIVSPPDGKKANYTNAWATYTGYHELVTPTAATIYSQYACSIPVPKSGFSVFLSVLVADLVMLSGLWAICTFLVSLLLDKRGQNTMFCQGCTQNLDYGLVEHESHMLHGKANEVVTTWPKREDTSDASSTSLCR